MGFLESWFRTTESNLTTSHSRLFSHNWGSRIITPHPPTLRPTDKLRSRTNSCLRLSRLDSKGQTAYGQTSCQVYCGRTRRWPKHPQETAFQLVYESNIVIPAKVGLTSYRMENHDESRNDKAMRLQLDLVDEVRATAKQNLA